jgi:hypothetical protein
MKISFKKLGGIMKGLVLKLFLIIVGVSVPVFAQQGAVPASQPEGLSWGWLMTLGLLVGMVLGFVIRPKRVSHTEDDESRRDRAA